MLSRRDCMKWLGIGGVGLAAGASLAAPAPAPKSAPNPLHVKAANEVMAYKPFIVAPEAISIPFANYPINYYLRHNPTGKVPDLGWLLKKIKHSAGLDDCKAIMEIVWEKVRPRGPGYGQVEELTTTTTSKFGNERRGLRITTPRYTSDVCELTCGALAVFLISPYCLATEIINRVEQSVAVAKAEGWPEEHDTVYTPLGVWGQLQAYMFDIFSYVEVAGVTKPKK